MVVHYGGYACDMKCIMDIARKYNLKVIEDAAHAAGSWLDDRHLGTWGDIGCFSFFSNKNMTTGEGGMVVTNDDYLFEKLRLLRSHGMTSLTWDRHKGHAWSYDVVDLGYNYRLDEIRSALGRVQLKKLEQNNAIRRECTAIYHRLLSEQCSEVDIPFRSHQGVSACHLLPVLLPARASRTAVMEHLKTRGIQTSIHYPPVHQFSAYRYLEGCVRQTLVNTEDLAARQLTLPLFPSITEADIKIVTHTLSEALGSRFPDASERLHKTPQIQ